jgi:hypothetical protein
MITRVIKIFMPGLLIGLFLPALALAHNPMLLVEETNKGGIVIKAAFSDGTSAAGVDILIKEKATGRILEVVTLPENGMTEIPRPSVPYTVSFDAGGGHLVTREGPFSTAPSEALPAAELEAQPGREAPADLLVVSALPPLFWISSALCRDSAIQVIQITPPDVTLREQAAWLQAHEDDVKGLLQRADAVVTIRRAWPQDPVYGYARRCNIRVVELDASAPFDPALNGVPLLAIPTGRLSERPADPRTDRISPYLWLSLSNAAALADILAADLKRLLPTAAARVAANLSRFKQEVLELKTRYALAFAEIEAFEAVALTGRLIYLTSDINLPVSGYFLKDAYYWTPADFEQFRRTLLDLNVPVVVHAWSPKPEIAQIIREAGAALAVLDPLERAAPQHDIAAGDRYLHEMAHNLKTLLEALRTSPLLK